jgi:cob(I)alamin adenosyltransferase
MAPKIYTRQGDDGTTGLLFGGRVGKDTAGPDAYGAVDEAVSALGLVRAEVERGSELDEIVVHLQRELFVVGAELATAPENRAKLTPGVSLVTAEMVSALEPVSTVTVLRPRRSSCCRARTGSPRSISRTVRRPSGGRRATHHGCSATAARWCPTQPSRRPRVHARPPAGATCPAPAPRRPDRPPLRRP